MKKGTCTQGNITYGVPVDHQRYELPPTIAIPKIIWEIWIIVIAKAHFSGGLSPILI